MSLVEPRNPAGEDPFTAVAQAAVPIMCDELERRCGVRPAAASARRAQVRRGDLGGHLYQVFRATLESETGHRVPLALILRERDGALLMGDPSGSEGLPLALFQGLRRALEERTRVAFGEPRPDLMSDLSWLPEGELDVADCCLVLGDKINVLVMPLPGALEAFEDLEAAMTIAMRPRLVDTVVPLHAAGEIDERVLDALPVQLEVTLQTEPVTVGKIASLRVGDALRLDERWSRMVRITVGGRTLATGELLMVGTKWGVLVHEVGG